MTRARRQDNTVADVETLSIGGVQKAMGWERIDLVKLDIEGGEQALFEANLEWMECTRFIVLEFHERMVPSSSKPAPGPRGQGVCRPRRAGRKRAVWSAFTGLIFADLTLRHDLENPSVGACGVDDFV